MKQNLDIEACLDLDPDRSRQGPDMSGPDRSRQVQTGPDMSGQNKNLIEVLTSSGQKTAF